MARSSCFAFFFFFSSRRRHTRCGRDWSSDVCSPDLKTIQSDTNEAVISMEHTTAEVVRGARLAQDAGIALEEIENVSMSLAELIQNISNAARQQSSSAAHISNTMNVIQEITSQTSSGTNATAKSIGNLAEMASELRSSVAGFTLPDEDQADLEQEQDNDIPVVS